MGNCFFGAMADSDTTIKVTTSNGGIMEFSAPITVSFITKEFPGHAIFKSHDLFWKPLNQFDELETGQSYYLLPINNNVETSSEQQQHVVRQGHVRSNSLPTTSYPAPYRMSLDYTKGMRFLKKCSREREHLYSRRSVSKRCKSSNKFWKVKLVISPEQLVEILGQEGRTKELIESVRIVAKCGVGGCISSVAEEDNIVSDHQWSLSSTSWSISSKIDALAVGI
ncbi:uncharacterized protein [Cicer arietinum]|uniref:Uncharacterized protein LOC101509832 n=1 Tax=Cicer arietinum TaxID=3827 RepID=A0A1S2XYG4_CICAR|nr:uncharacterized protein LOC101509832 [Cicer arietinum]